MTFAAVGCGVVNDHRDLAPDRLSPDEKRVDLGGPPIDWDRPFGGATAVGSLEEARADVSFVPVMPGSLGLPLKILASPSADAVAWLYDDPVMGRFIVIERRSVWTQSQLESLATCDPKSGCEGEWSLRSIRSGVTALFVSGSKTTGLIWLESGLTFDVYGPSPMFTPAMAIKVADGI